MLHFNYTLFVAMNIISFSYLTSHLNVFLVQLWLLDMVDTF